jgi:hypothetical protein
MRQTMLAIVLLSFAGRALAGGGMILSNDVCIVTIGFYTAHFTGYQPQTNDNTEFCGEFPNVGETIMVLDYLHKSLREVPVDFRIIHDVVGKGDFVQYEDVEALENLDELTVFYQPPIVKANETMNITHVFVDEGSYIGIITAGHPTNDNIYTAVFPFTVGVSRFPWAIASLLLAIVIGGLFLWRMMAAGKSKQA